MLNAMDSRRRSPLATLIAPTAVPSLPVWATSRQPDRGEADAAFAAGIALKSLDDLVRIEPAWGGCWRQRLALRCAQAAVQLIGHAFEGRRPALADNLLQIFNAPLFLTAEVVALLGGKRSPNARSDAP